MRRGGEEVAVVAVDFLATVLGRAGEVKRIGGAEEKRGWKGGHASAGAIDEFVPDGQPYDDLLRLVFGKLLQRQTETSGVKATLTLMAFQAGNHFEPTMSRTNKITPPCHPGHDFLRAVFARINLQQIGNVEVVHDGTQRASRSSEIITVESKSIFGSLDQSRPVKTGRRAAVSGIG